MRVLLANPPAGKVFIREGRCMNRQSTWDSIWPPLTLMYISSALKAEGHETLILDSNTISEEEFFKRAKGFSPELSIINTATPTIERDLSLAAFLKKETRSKTAAIGVHPTSLDREILEKTPSLDFVIRNEPEMTSAELARSISEGLDLGKVRGISFRRGGKIVSNKPRPFIGNLDSLPFPDRDGIDCSLYKMPFSSEVFTIVNPSRGCPYSCIFCTASTFYGKAFRKRSPKSVCSEIEQCVSRHGIRTFLFWADEFTLDREYVLSLSREIVRRGLKIKWFANSRVDTCDEALFREMKKAGCFLISFGIESGEQKVLDLARKGTRISQARRAVLSAKRAGIETIGHFILGLPGETRKSAEKTISFSKGLGLDYAQFYIATPYPGTPFHNYCVREGLIEKGDFAEMEISNAAIRQGELSAKELLGLRKKAYFSFYSRPLYFLGKAAKVFLKGGFPAFGSAFRHLSDWGDVGK